MIDYYFYLINYIMWIFTKDYNHWFLTIIAIMKYYFSIMYFFHCIFDSPTNCAPFFILIFEWLVLS